MLVQTIAPSARAIIHAARHDADGFLAEELTRRRALSYPPFGSLIRIVCGAESAADAHAIAAELRGAIAPAGATVLGPAPLFKLRGKARSQLVIKAGGAGRGDPGGRSRGRPDLEGRPAGAGSASASTSTLSDRRCAEAPKPTASYVD